MNKPIVIFVLGKINDRCQYENIIKEKNMWIYLTFFSPSNLAGNIATQFVHEISMQKCYPS